MPDNIPVPPAADAFMRRNDPEHIQLIADMQSVKGEITMLREATVLLQGTTASLQSAAERVERRLLGEWDDEKREWRPGVLQEMQTIGRLGKTGLKAIYWFGSIFTAVLVTVVTLLIENYVHLHAITTK